MKNVNFPLDRWSGIDELNNLLQDMMESGGNYIIVQAQWPAIPHGWLKRSVHWPMEKPEHFILTNFRRCFIRRTCRSRPADPRMLRQ